MGIINLINKLINVLKKQNIKSIIRKIFSIFQSDYIDKIYVNPPKLRRVELIEYLSFDDKAFSKSYPIVQVRDAFTREIKNVYEFQLRYELKVEPIKKRLFIGSVFLMEDEGDNLL